MSSSRNVDRYAHPAKDGVRRHWARFVGAAFSRDQRADARILFLPGPGGYEIPLYEEAGFQRKHLYGVEQIPKFARTVRDVFPGIHMSAVTLKQFLATDEQTFDVANLDFDGSAITFQDEILEVVRRFRFCDTSVLAISSLGSRPQQTLIQSATAASVWHSMNQQFHATYDLLNRENSNAGLVLVEPTRTHMACREVAVQLLLLRALGERTYADDADEAELFRTRFSEAAMALSQRVGERIADSVRSQRAIPIETESAFRDAVQLRRVPIRLCERLRFVYKSLSGTWRWTWAYRLERTERLHPLMRIAWQLGVDHPPLHYIDFTGVVVSGRRRPICSYCDNSEEENT